MLTHNTVDTYVHYLRAKLGRAAVRISTVRGIGYRMAEP
jgi:DNA-binding response OmpR family regulator